jgi:hypothetical protein
VRVVLLFSGWVRLKCARLWCVHEAPPRGPRSGRGPPRRGICVSELKKSHRRRYFRSPVGPRIHIPSTCVRESPPEYASF